MTQLTWPQRGRLWLRLGMRLAGTLLTLWGAVRLGPPLLSLSAPFLLALLLAWALSPAVGWFQRRLGWRRGFSALVLLLLTFGGLAALVWSLAAGVAEEAAELAGSWEEGMASLAGRVADLDAALDRFSRLFRPLPAALRQAAGELSGRLLAWLETAIPRLLSAAADWLGGLVLGLPSFAVACLVFVLAAYSLTVDFPRLRARAAGGIPAGGQALLARIREAAAAGFVGYLKAQLLLSVGVFFLLLSGFFLLRQPYLLLLAFLLAVLDFIPLLGAGTVMVPWAAADLLTGEPRHGVGLLAVWAAAALFRRLTEPRVLGRQTGLPPVLSLAGLYVGMRLGGVMGMVLSPILCLVGLDLVRSGVLAGTAADLRLAAGDLAALWTGAGT